MPALLLLIAPWLSGGCATSQKGVTKRVSLTIEVRHLDGRLQWRTTQINEAGTDDPPGMSERIDR